MEYIYIYIYMCLSEAELAGEIGSCVHVRESRGKRLRRGHLRDWSAFW